jgi:hypothetical protein
MHIIRNMSSIKLVMLTSWPIYRREILNQIRALNTLEYSPLKLYCMVVLTVHQNRKYVPTFYYGHLLTFLICGKKTALFR